MQKIRPINRMQSMEVYGHKQSYDEYKMCKVLPHIIQQFHYRVQNRLLFEKIINPRRDKIIMESVFHTSFKSPSKKKKKARNHTSLNYRRKVLINRSNQIPTQPSFSTQSHHREYSQTIQLNQMSQTDKQTSNNSSHYARFKQTSDSISKLGPADTTLVRQNGIGKIVKNMKAWDRIKQEQPPKMQIKVNSIVDQPQEPPLSNESKTQNLSSYLKRPNLKKLQKKRYRHNKQNTLTVENY